MFFCDMLEIICVVVVGECIFVFVVFCNYFGEGVVWVV